ncbi:MAG: hypothetical protein DI551_05555 [Micavibrio aeruginosavorus]|uniref:DUF983 domain-containing protein n=1 Tax=Micavibrio aeruginosavorus TaxID=349221 RepID=A0A2W5MYA5_9BACT|nr:MAG: hypothetical protein DI551_05555 [Micavibrio aeruginosavorus]
MTQTPPLSLIQTLSRGIKGKCPHCGEGRLFRKWLKVIDRCEVCGEEFHHHRADDFPAYIVVAILGHVMVTFALLLEDLYAPPFWVHLATTLPLTFLLAVALLQPAKGAVVAVQWRMGLHGFAASKRLRDGAPHDAV